MSGDWNSLEDEEPSHIRIGLDASCLLQPLLRTPNTRCDLVSPNFLVGASSYHCDWDSRMRISKKKKHKSKAFL